MIEAGRVAVNGKVIDSPALNVTDADRIRWMASPWPRPTRRAVALSQAHRPGDHHARRTGPRTIFDDLPDDLPRVMSVGRLDLNSEGLLLLTNDGGLKRGWNCPRRAGCGGTGCA
jgi:23S rRNA pseudouridine2605 synthase